MQTLTVAKTLLVRVDGRILVLTRSETDTRRPGELDFPGGQIDPGEDILVGGAREIQEETGLVVPVSRLSIIYTATEPYPDISVSRVLLLSSYQPVMGEVQLSHEHSAYAWMSVSNTLEQFASGFYVTGVKYAREHELLEF